MEKNYYFQGKGKEIISLIKGGKQIVQPGIFLRESILRDLKRANDYLKKHSEGRFCLVVLSGYRSRKFQEICREGVEKQKRPNGVKPVDELFSDQRVYSAHATGAAFDLEIWDGERSCFLPTKFLNREETRGGYRLEEIIPQSVRDEAIKKNRRLLYNLLASEEVLGEDHFIGHPEEYWHFGRNERLSAFFAGGDHPVYYDMI